MDIYNFNFDHGKMLCDSKSPQDCTILQINNTENYVRYHLVSLMEQIRKSEKSPPLKALILGCTHYPYLVKHRISRLYNYKGKDGKYIYKRSDGRKSEHRKPCRICGQGYSMPWKKKSTWAKMEIWWPIVSFISVPNLKIECDHRWRWPFDLWL